MIKFFRKIRRNLLSEGKTEKYLKYAIGEIILVVLGILIALQINNWNEKRKSSEAKIESLEVIQTNLSQEKNRLNYVIEAKQLAILRMEKILNEDFDNLDFEKLYDNLTTFHNHLVANTGYKLISQNNNINFIENSELTKELILFYETHYTFLTSWGNFDQNYAENLMAPYILANIPSEPNQFQIEVILSKELETINFRNLLVNKIKLDKAYINVIQTKTFLHIEKLQALLKHEFEE